MEETASFDRRAGLTGDGLSFHEWRITANPSALRAAVNDLAVDQRLAWVDMNDARFKKVFNYLNTLSDFAKIRSDLSNVWSSESARVAFEEIVTSGRGIEACTIWIFDPNQMKLFSINAKG